MTRLLPLLIACLRQGWLQRRRLHASRFPPIS
jgi:hypothetical protein